MGPHPGSQTKRQASAATNRPLPSNNQPMRASTKRQHQEDHNQGPHPGRHNEPPHRRGTLEKVRPDHTAREGRNRNTKSCEREAGAASDTRDRRTQTSITMNEMRPEYANANHTTNNMTAHYFFDVATTAVHTAKLRPATAARFRTGNSHFPFRIILKQYHNWHAGMGTGNAHSGDRWNQHKRWTRIMTKRDIAELEVDEIHRACYHAVITSFRHSQAGIHPQLQFDIVGQ